MFSTRFIRFNKSTLSILSFIGLMSCSDNSQVDADTVKYNLPEVVDYNFHIKPILSDTCFLCHGPDATNAKAGLSLNTFERATQHVLDSGNHAIDHEKLTFKYQGRRFRLTDVHGKIVKGIFA